MSKIDLNAKLSKKATVISIVLIAAFILGGALTAILCHKAYLDKRSPAITNYSQREGATLRRRNDGILVYCYENETDVDLSKIIETTKDATLSVIGVSDINKNYLSPSMTIDLSAHPHLFVWVRVVAFETGKYSDYFLEIVHRDDYRQDEPIPPLFENGEDDIVVLK